MAKTPARKKAVTKVPATVHATVAVAIVLLIFFVTPFIGAVLFAALIAYIFSPIYSYLLRKTNRGSLTIAATLIAIALAAIIPLVFLVLVTVSQLNSLLYDLQNNQATSASVDEIIQRGVDRVNEFLVTLPGGDELLLEKQDVVSTLKDLGVKMLNGLLNFITSTGTAFFDFISTLILAIFLIIAMLKHQAKIFAVFSKISPFDDSINNLYLSRAAAMTKAMVKGQFIIAAIQGFLSAGSLWLVGLDYFWLFVTVLSFLSFIPLGAGIITIPIGIVMILLGNFWQGLFVILFHMFVVSSVDNLLRPYLVPKEARLNSGLLLLAVFSGMAVFGPAGVIFGPVIMILLISTIEIYAQYNEGRIRPKLLARKS